MTLMVRYGSTVETNGRWLNLQVLVEIGNQMYKITAILYDTVKCRCVVESVWLCDWCKIYGKHPLEKCWHLASEPKVKTVDGEEICQTCATNWKAAKKK